MKTLDLDFRFDSLMNYELFEKQCSQWHEFVNNQHDVECNQKYGGKFKLPYSFHLQVVHDTTEQIISPILEPSILKSAILCISRGHDLIEDARVSYADIKLHFTNVQAGNYIADGIYACTETRGRNRNERHGQEFINTLLTHKGAIIVKLSDTIANLRFSILTNSGMKTKYKKEFYEIWKPLVLKFNEDNPEERCIRSAYSILESTVNLI